MSNNAIKTNVDQLATALVSGYDFNKDTGVVKYQGVDEKVAAILPEGMSMEQLKSAQELLIDVTAAHTLATGRVGMIELKGKTELNKIQAKSNVGYSAIETSYWKEQTGTTAGKPWRKVGKATSDLVIGVGRKATPYKDVQRHLAEQAESVFSN